MCFFVHLASFTMIGQREGGVEHFRVHDWREVACSSQILLFQMCLDTLDPPKCILTASAAIALSWPSSASKLHLHADASLPYRS